MGQAEGLSCSRIGGCASLKSREGDIGGVHACGANISLLFTAEGTFAVGIVIFYDMGAFSGGGIRRIGSGESTFPLFGQLSEY